jgi:signal transduction histidine kinase
MGPGSRRRHLIFLIHLWALMPFGFYWPNAPEVKDKLLPAEKDDLTIAVWAIFAYLLIRTFLALRDSKLMRWDFIFPPIDIVVVSVLIKIVDGTPLSNVALLYFLPLVEAAQNLNWRWSLVVAWLTIIGSIIASNLSKSGLQREMIPEPPLDDAPFNIVFRLFFFILMSSLITQLTKQAAEYRAQVKVEADRNHLALEMHDGLQGSLITAASQVELAQTLIDRDPDRAAQVAADTRQTLRQASDELRFLVQRLRKNDLVGGFEPALRQYASNICERNNLQLEFGVDGKPEKLGAETENALFRIAQEALANVLKHAQASKVGIRLRYEKDNVHMTISDNGIGFEEQKFSVDHSGLEGMKERAKDRHGTLSVKHLEHGTKISVSMPRTSLWTRKFV